MPHSFPTRRSSDLTADPVLEDREWLTLENAPVGQDIRTLSYTITEDDARTLGNEQIQPMELFTGSEPLVHPAVIARHMISLLEIGRAHAELQSLMRISYAVFCLKKKKTN